MAFSCYNQPTDMKLRIGILYLILNAPMYFIIVSWIIYAVFSRLGKYHKTLQEQAIKTRHNQHIFACLRPWNLYHRQNKIYRVRCKWKFFPRWSRCGDMGGTASLITCPPTQLPGTVLDIVSSADQRWSVAPGCPLVTSRRDSESTLLSIVLTDQRWSSALLY